MVGKQKRAAARARQRVIVHHSNVRQLTEEREIELSPHAQQSRLSQGRQTPEEPCPIRTDFQRDRDRIIHSNSFRRLKHKTQVFVAPLGDHFVTRLTHTLEVSQIARTIARALNLNEDLTEAISLGHDLGHTPFGHIGEEVLNDLHAHGFRHNEQSLRVVEILERGGHGLNLTWEVRDGILHHSKSRAGFLARADAEAATLEGAVCRIADAIAYVNHDSDDAIRAGVITEGDLPLAAVSVIGLRRSDRINAMVSDVIDNSWAVRGTSPDEAGSTSFVPSNRGEVSIAMSQPVLEATRLLREFLFERVYDVSSARYESDRARQIIRHLYEFFKEHEDRLPAEYRLLDDTRERRVIDFIAGMTDRYALKVAEDMSLLDGEVVQPRMFLPD